MSKGKLFYGWWVVIGAIIVLAVMGPATVAVANLFQAPVTAEFGISNSQFAINNSIVLGMGIFLSPMISQKLATGNFKLIYTIGVLCYALGYAGYGLAPNILVFYLLSVVVGIGNTACIIIPTGILVNNWFVKKRGLAMSLALTGLGLGGAIWSPVLTWLIETLGWRETYMTYGGFMLLVGLAVTWFIFKPKPSDVGLRPYGAEEVDELRADSEAEDGEQQQLQGVALSMNETLTKPFFLLLIAGAVLTGIVNNGGLGQFPPVFQNMHGATTAATIVSVYSAVGIIGKIVLGNFSDRYGVMVSTLYTSILLVLTYLVILLAGNVTFAFIMAVLFGLGNAGGTVLPPLVTSAMFSSDNYPKAYGYVQGGVQLGMTLGSLVAAGIADLTGTYTVSWIVMAIASALLGVSWISSYKGAQKYMAR